MIRGIWKKWLELRISWLSSGLAALNTAQIRHALGDKAWKDIYSTCLMMLEREKELYKTQEVEHYKKQFGGKK